MRFIYTRHVHVRLRQRELSKEQIEAVIRFADARVPSFKGRTVAQKAWGSKTLEVVYRKLNDHVVIITAYWQEEGD